jgi:2-iminoacetate synthase ThiH
LITIETLELVKSTDLVEVGMRADAERQRRHPGRIVTYCLDSDMCPDRVVLDLEHKDGLLLDGLSGSVSIAPICAPGRTAVDYLRVLAACRLYSDIDHIQVALEWTGLKLAQVALTFGADDIGCRKPGSQVTEEEIRRVIREAGFSPKKRDREYRSLSLF